MNLHVAVTPKAVVSSLRADWSNSLDMRGQVNKWEDDVADFIVSLLRELGDIEVYELVRRRIAGELTDDQWAEAARELAEWEDDD